MADKIREIEVSITITITELDKFDSKYNYLFIYKVSDDYSTATLLNFYPISNNKTVTFKAETGVYLIGVTHCTNPNDSIYKNDYSQALMGSEPSWFFMTKISENKNYEFKRIDFSQENPGRS